MEDEIGLLDYFKVLWKRKWIVIGGTILSLVIAGVLSSRVKPVYRVEAIIHPGHYFIKTELGNIAKIEAEKYQQIAFKVKSKAYNNRIAQELGIDESEIPEIKAGSIESLGSAVIWIDSHEKEKAKKVLDFLVLLITKEIDKVIEDRVNSLEWSIKKAKTEEKIVKTRINALKKRLNSISERKKEIAGEIEFLITRIDDARKEYKDLLTKETRDKLDNFLLALYRNMVNQLLNQIDDLRKILAREKIIEEETALAILNANSRMEIKENEVKNKEWMKSLISYTEITKEPQVSKNPLPPGKKLIVLVTGVMAVLVLTLFVFFLEVVDKRKIKIQ